MEILEIKNENNQSKKKKQNSVDGFGFISKM